ncbi:MAG TPA: protein kinase [Firmicutes bacterium]|nr:protein kinase [Bacillota bacterium]
MAEKLRKPHKFLLLLAAVDIIGGQNKPQNRIYYNDHLKASFSRLIESFELDIGNRPYIPFFHLKNDSFWYLQPLKGREIVLEQMSTAVKPSDITNNVEYAFFSDPVFGILKNEMSRREVRNKLITIVARYAKAQPENDLRGPYLSAEKEGEYHLRASLFNHERQAIDRISDLLGTTMQGLSNVHIFDKQTNYYYEYDLIIVGRSGIYVVELKHWTGNIEVKEYQWRIDGTRYRVDPHKSNTLKCKILKGIYQHEFATYPNIWVESVVVLTNPEATVHNNDTPDIASEKKRHNFTFASIEDLISFLRRRESTTILSDAEVAAVAKFLASLSKRKHETQYVVPGYETVEYLSQKPECVELLAKPIGIKGKGLNRLRVFRFIQESKSERERFRKIALNTLNAVQQIEDKSYIHEVSVLQLDSGDIVEISDWSDVGTLRDFISDAVDTWTLNDKLKMCKNIAEALSQAHEQLIIHRAVKPENILIENDVPKLMNFDFAFQPEDERLTVMPTTARVQDDGYVAPELLSGEDIDESTDYFSLGVITYQLLTGEKPFKRTRQFLAGGGKLDSQHIERLKAAKVPEALIDGINGIIVADREERGNGVNKFLSALTSGEPTVDKARNARLEPGAKFDVREIIEFIGEGRESQVYKARASRQRIVALKVFNYETPLERVLREIDIGCQVNSPYVVHYDADPGHWNNERFFAVMDFVPGGTLRRSIDQGQKPDRAFFERVARALMEGIRALHENKDEYGKQKTIIHGDIKPDNVIITPSGQPVLIDLGLAGPPRIELYQGTSPYVPPYSIRGADREFSYKCDLFALGVTLWEWLFGKKPYSNPFVGEEPTLPEILSEFEDLYPWLTRVISTKPDKGFATITEMWDMFIKPEPAEQETIDEEDIQEEQEASKEVIIDKDHVAFSVYNPFVDYLNTLTAVSAGNENAIAENQIQSEHFAKIHVPNPLSNEVSRLINQGKSVILTGNAGDGKTTIAIEVLKSLTGYDIREIKRREEVPHHNLVVIKDMSELPSQDHSSILQEAWEDIGTKYLIVSNTGTLLNAFQALGSKMERKLNVQQILAALGASEPQEIAEGRFILLNIGQLDSIDTACQVAGRMLESKNWSSCYQCAIQESCVIYKNVKLLQSNREQVLDRVYYFYKRLYEYGYRLTMRQMTGHLAYALTGGLSCSDLSNMSLLARQKQLKKVGFTNWFFGDDGLKVVPEAINMKPVRVIRKEKFGMTLVPEFERRAWLKKDLFQMFNPEARKIYEELDKEHCSATRHQIRRLAYFCGRFSDARVEQKFISTFLNTPMLFDYLTFTEGKSSGSLSQLSKMRAQILHILQEQFMGLRLPEASWSESNDIYITLKPPLNVAITQMVLARFRKDDFELIVKPRYRYSSDTRAQNMLFYLIYKHATEVELQLDLPFFDYVARRYKGELTHELSVYYLNRLEDFKGKLLNAFNEQAHRKDEHSVLHLVRVRPDRRFEDLKLHIDRDKLEVS